MLTVPMAGPVRVTPANVMSMAMRMNARITGPRVHGGLFIVSSPRRSSRSMPAPPR